MTDNARLYIKRLFELIPPKSSQQIAVELENAGYSMSKSTIDRLKRKERDLELGELLMFSSVYHFKPELVLSCMEENSDPECEQGLLDLRNFITDPDADEFKGYLGSYYCWFYSTAMEEAGEWIEGKIVLEKEETGRRHCRASVRLYLENGRVKCYQGYAVVSKMQAIWVCLTEPEMGDFATIVFRYRPFLEECQCRLGAVLTVGAGEYKQPVFQKIFLSRKRMSEECLKRVAAVLKLDLSKLRIPQNAWEKWAGKNPSVAEKIPLLKENTCIVNLNTIIENAQVSLEDVGELVALTQNERLYRLVESEDRFSFQLLDFYIKQESEWKFEQESSGESI